MIYLCKHCGFRSYHQGVVSNPFCPECRLNKSEVVPMPGEFKARIRNDIDHEILSGAVAGLVNGKGGIERYLQIGEDVTVSLEVHIKVPGVNGTAKIPFDAAMEILEIPDGYGPSIFMKALETFNVLKKFSEGSGLPVMTTMDTEEIESFKARQLGRFVSDGSISLKKEDSYENTPEELIKLINQEDGRGERKRLIEKLMTSTLVTVEWENKTADHVCRNYCRYTQTKILTIKTNKITVAFCPECFSIMTYSEKIC